MKKYKSLILIVVVVLLLIGLLFILKNDDSESNFISNDPEVILENAKEEAENSKKRTDLKEMTEITVDEYINYYNSQEPTAVLFTDKVCDNCELAEYILKEIITDNKIDIKIIYTDKIEENDNKKLIQLNEFFEYYGTPVLTLIGNSTIINRVDGLTDKIHYLKFFEDNGVLK